MKTKLLSKLVFASLLTTTASAFATGFVTLPRQGTEVEGGRSAYVTCNVSGDFGSDPNGSTPPTFAPNGGENNTCAIPGHNPPLPGFAIIADATRNIVMNNVYTNRQPISVGVVLDRVWRKGKECIFGSKIRLNNVDYDRRAGSAGFQYFEVNDFLRGGFRKFGPVSVAYRFTTAGASASDEVLYRAGLSLTSVVNFPGDPAQPLTSVAPINPNWVSFTSDINFLDDDGSSFRDSPWFFVKSACGLGKVQDAVGALRFRQLGQEEQPLIEVKVNGFSPVAIAP